MKTLSGAFISIFTASIVREMLVYGAEGDLALVEDNLFRSECRHKGGCLGYRSGAAAPDAGQIV